MIDTLPLELALARLRAKFAEDQPRDDHGRFSDGGAGTGSSGSSSPRELPDTSSVGRAFDAMGADRFDRSYQEHAHPENYEPNRGYGVHLREGATEWRQSVDANGVPTIYQVIGTDNRTLAPEDRAGAGLPMTAPDGTPVVSVPVAGSERPDPYVYRVMSNTEFDQAETRGYIQSNGSMNLVSTEGTVASRGSTGSFYAPTDGSDYRVVQIRMNPDDGWRVGSDGYVKTQQAVPFSAVEAYSQSIAGDPDTSYRVGKAKYAEDQPRDDHGRFASSGVATMIDTGFGSQRGTQWDFDPRDTAIEQRALRENPVAQENRAEFPRGTRIVSVGARSHPTEGMRGTVDKTHPDGSADGGSVGVTWDDIPGFVGQVNPNAIVREDEWDQFRAMKSFKYSDDQPRDDHGRWTDGGGDSSSSGPDLTATHALLYGEHAGTPADPVPCGSDIERAARIIADGGNVTLNQPEEIATLLDKMQELVKEAEAKGEKAPTFDLCDVSVPGTNLFCQDHVVDDQGNPLDRIQMPQLATTDPVPGSLADQQPRNAFGEVDLSGQFAEFLAQTGRPPVEEMVNAATLRASQDQLNGAKVAGIVDAIEAGTYDVTTGRIWITSDNYVIDGHHRWAAAVAETYSSGNPVELPVRRLDMDIGTALTTANYWTEENGIQGRSLTAKSFDPNQPRDDHGRWAGDGGGTDGVPTDMSLMERVRLLQYVGSGSDWLNAGLHGGTASTEAQELKGLADRSTLSEPLTLYRGGSAAEFADLKPGDTVASSQFVSTSMDPAIAKQSADTAGVRSLDGSSGWTAEISAPAGTHAIDVNKTLGEESPLPHEQEVLIGAGTAFHIDEVDPDAHTVKATIVPPPKPKAFVPVSDAAFAIDALDVLGLVIPMPKYSPDQPRDDHGRFGSTDGGGGAVTNDSFDAAARFTPREIGTTGETTTRYAGWYKGLSEQQQRALIQWQEWGKFPQIQSLLRQQPISPTTIPIEALGTAVAVQPMEQSQVPGTVDIINNLDAAIASAPPLPEDTVVYRAFDADQFGELHTGQILRDDGFVATGVEEAAANSSGSELDTNRQHDDVLAEVLLPAGTRVGVPPMDGWFEGPDDTQIMSDEAVIPRGSSFTVVDTEPVRLALTSVPDSPPPIPDHVPAPKNAPSLPPFSYGRFVWHLGDLVDVTSPGSKALDLAIDLAMLGIKYSPDQPRDDRGRFGEGSGGTITADDPAELLSSLDNGLNTAAEVGAAIQQLGAVKVEFPQAPGEDPIYVYQPPDGSDPTVIAWNGSDSYSQTFDANEWIYDQDVTAYYPEAEQQWNDDFWRNPDVLYHGTDADNIDSILQDGLQMRYETRGMSNQYEGAAVYTSTDPDEPEYYYGQVLVIDTAAMKADGVQPFVNQEPDVFEGGLREALASQIGLEGFEYEYESGMSPTTVVVNDDVPPKYISVMSLQKARLKYSDDQPRDDSGRWTSGGALMVRDLADPTKKFPEPRELPVFGLTQAAQDEVYSRLERVGITHAALCEEIANRIGPANSELMNEAIAWYPEAHDTAASIAESSGGRIDQEHAEGVIAALSPQMEWDANVKAAEGVADYVSNGLADGKTPEAAALDFINQQAASAAELDQGKMFQTADNVTKAMSIAMGGSIDDNLTGMKVRSFYNNIDDPNDTRDVTIDTHMAKVLTAVSPGLEKTGTTNGSALGLLNASSAKEGQQYGGAGYIAISEAVRSVSSQLGVPPDAVQAAYWLSVRDISFDDIRPATP